MAFIKPNKNLWFNKGSRRKKQVYNWLADIIDFHYPTAFREVTTLYILGQFKASIEAFKELIIGNIKDRNLENLGYLIDENQEVFGNDRIILDLFNNVVLPNIKRVQVKKKTKQLKAEGITLKKFKQKSKSTQVTFFGVNKQGKREKAVLTFVAVKMLPQVRLRSVKTGRFLKQTETFKKEIKRRGL